MKDFSIECAQPYGASNGNMMLDVLQQVLSELKQDNKTWALVLQVDDVSYTDKTFDFAGYAGWLEHYGFKPNLVLRESQIVSLADKLRERIDLAKCDASLAKVLRDERYPSQLLIATWSLVRLGQLTTELFDRELVAKAVVNVLPRSWKPGEDESLEIMRAAGFAEAVERVNYRFVDGL